MSRDRRGRFTAERTTETTTTTVTERVTVEPPARPPLPAGGPEPLFTHLLSYPPAGARWAHPAFIAAEAARAAAGFRDGVGVFPPRHGRPETFVVPFDDTAPVPVIRVPVPRTYPELEPATLAMEFEAEVTHEFTEADAVQLAAELTTGRSA